MPRLITSMPAARLSAIRRSSSANMYGGIAWSRREGSVRAKRQSLASGVGERLDEADDVHVRRLGPADLPGSLPAIPAIETFCRRSAWSPEAALCHPAPPPLPLAARQEGSADAAPVVGGIH